MRKKYALNFCTWFLAHREGSVILPQKAAKESIELMVNRSKQQVSNV